MQPKNGFQQNYWNPVEFENYIKRSGNITANAAAAAAATATANNNTCLRVVHRKTVMNGFQRSINVIACCNIIEYDVCKSISIQFNPIRLDVCTARFVGRTCLNKATKSILTDLYSKNLQPNKLFQVYIKICKWNWRMICCCCCWCQKTHQHTKTPRQSQHFNLNWYPFIFSPAANWSRALRNAENYEYKSNFSFDCATASTSLPFYTRLYVSKLWQLILCRNTYRRIRRLIFPGHNFTF